MLWWTTEESRSTLVRVSQKCGIGLITERKEEEEIRIRVIVICLVILSVTIQVGITSDQCGRTTEENIIMCTEESIEVDQHATETTDTAILEGITTRTIVMLTLTMPTIIAEVDTIIAMPQGITMVVETTATKDIETRRVATIQGRKIDTVVEIQCREAKNKRTNLAEDCMEGVRHLPEIDGIMTAVEMMDQKVPGVIAMIQEVTEDAIIVAEVGVEAETERRRNARSTRENAIVEMTVTANARNTKEGRTVKKGGGVIVETITVLQVLNPKSSTI